MTDNTTETSNVCIDQIAEIVSVCEGNPLSDWTNVILTFLAVAIAGFSAWCAWHANKSSKLQSSREYFDKICGDKFHEKLNEIRLQFRPVKSRLVRNTGFDGDEIANIEVEINSIRASINELYIEALTIDELLKLEDDQKIQDIADEIQDKLMSLIGYIKGQEDDWYDRSNSCVDAIEAKLAKTRNRYLDLRNNYQLRN